MAVNFEYGRRNGWLSCGLTVDNASVLHSVNGWHDGLGELIRAACSMFARANEATAYFQEEPGEFRWRINRLTVNRIRVRVIEFDDWASIEPDKAGKLLFEASCGIFSFAAAIYDGSGKWLTELQNEGRNREAESLHEKRVQLGAILRRLNYSS